MLWKSQQQNTVLLFVLNATQTKQKIRKTFEITNEQNYYKSTTKRTKTVKSKISQIVLYCKFTIIKLSTIQTLVEIQYFCQEETTAW